MSQSSNLHSLQSSNLRSSQSQSQSQSNKQKLHSFISRLTKNLMKVSLLQFNSTEKNKE